MRSERKNTSCFHLNVSVEDGVSLQGTFGPHILSLSLSLWRVPRHDIQNGRNKSRTLYFLISIMAY